MPSWLVVFPSLLLFVLPFAHVTSLRSLGFVGTLLLLLWILVRERPRLPLKAPLAFWLVVASMSLLWSANLTYSLDEWRGDVLYGIATFYAFVLLTRGADDLRRWRRITAASMALIGLLAVVSYVRRGEWVHGYHNLIGEYSTFVITAMPLILTAYLAGPLSASRRERALTSGAIALALCGGLFAKSRAFWLVIALGGVLVSALLAARNLTMRRTALLSLAIVALLTTAALAYATAQRGIRVDFFADRAAIYEFSRGLILKQPLTGSGFGREANRAAYAARFPDKGHTHAHNMPFSYAEQMGVWGLAACFWLFAALVLVYWRAWQSVHADILAAGLAGLVLVAAVVLKNLTDMFFYGHLLMIFFAHAGILAGYVRSRAPQSP